MNGIVILQYADDTSIKITHNNAKYAQCKLNRYLIELNIYFKKWKMLLNETKTEFMY